MIKDAAEAYRIIETARDAAPILHLMEDVASYDDQNRTNVLASALRTLHDMDYPEFGKILIDFAFRLSLSEMDSYVVHELLAAWFEAQSANERDQVIARLLIALEASEEALVLRAISIINSIGFRNDPLDKRLHNLLTQSSSAEIKDAALWALTWLGSTDVAGIEIALQPRLKDLANISVNTAACLRILRSDRLLTSVQHAYLTYTKNDSVLTTLMRALADTAWEYPEQAGSIWQILIGQPRELIERHINISGDIASRFDYSGIPDYFLVQILPSQPDLNPSLIPHHAAYQRLKSLFLPKTLEGLRQSAVCEQGEFLQTIEMDATANTEHPLPFQTARTVIKELSWEIALRLGLPHVYNWFPSALIETNPFTKGNIAEIAGFLRADSAVPALRVTVTTTEIHPILRNQILLALGYIGTEASLDALLQVRVPPERVPLDWKHALTFAILSTRRIEKLIDVQENPDADTSLQMTSAAALEMVAAADRDLVMPYRTRLVRVLAGLENPSDVRFRFLLFALNSLSLDEEHIQMLLVLARNAPFPIKLQASVVLAQHNRLLDQPDLCAEFGLEEKEDGWHLTRTLIENELDLLGILFQKEPQHFSKAMSSFLQGMSWLNLFQVIQSIEMLPQGELPISVQDQLAQRIRLNLRSILVEADLIKAFARQAPGRFLDLVEEVDIMTLPPQMRNALVDAMHHPAANSATTMRAAVVLLQLLTDDGKDTRASAAQILSEYYPKELSETVSNLCQSTLPKERIWGIQAAIHCTNETFRPLCQLLNHDAEVKVRKAATLATRTKKRRELASLYLKEIAKLSNGQILDVWHFGGALVEVGDENTIDKLRLMASDISINAHLRAWFLWLANKVDESQKTRMNLLEQDFD